MISNQIFKVPRGSISDIRTLPDVVEREAGQRLLRWYVSSVVDDTFVVEATVYRGAAQQEHRDVLASIYPGKTAVLSLIPTGVGCEVGGFAGDAAPATGLLASCVDYLVTNPNAVNASNFIRIADNVLYTEGYCIDLFARGLVDLHIPYGNKVGLIIERTDEKTLDLIYNIANTVRAIHGVHIEEILVTPELIGGRCVRNPSGAYVGNVDNPQVVLDACEHLIRRGVDAIAITSKVQDLPAKEYADHFLGKHPNPVGGAEAVISHLICSTFGLPAAHAPMINFISSNTWGRATLPPTLESGVVDARSAGERVSVCGLASVLIGLHRAPQITRSPQRRAMDSINLNNVLAVVAPASCLGGIPVFQAQRFGIPVIAVEENGTILGVDQSALGLSDVIQARTYAEAAGLIMALRHGISLPSIARPLKTLRRQTTE
jgi:hypothetical protein